MDVLLFRCLSVLFLYKIGYDKEIGFQVQMVINPSTKIKHDHSEQANSVQAFIYQSSRPSGSREEDVLKVFPI